MIYQVWMSNARGERLYSLQNASLIDYAKAVNGEGWFTIGLARELEPAALALDAVIEIWRQPEGESAQLEFVGFLRKWIVTDTSITLSGPGINELLTRRIVAYAAGSAEADQTNQADDMLKEIFDHNLGADATDADRRWSGFGLTSAAQVSAAPSITKAFSRKNVMLAMQEICASSSQAGTDLYFELVPLFGADKKLSAQFTTYIGQPGSNRTGNINPMVFGDTFGNLKDAALEYDYAGEVTVAYAGGMGEESSRTIEEREDTTRSGASSWNRRESFVDCRNEPTAAGVQAAGDAELNAKRPKVRFSGKLLDIPGSRYGVNWFYGDRVIIQYARMEFTALVRAVHVTHTSTADTVDVTVEVDL